MWFPCAHFFRFSFSFQWQNSFVLVLLIKTIIHHILIRHFTRLKLMKMRIFSIPYSQSPPRITMNVSIILRNKNIYRKHFGKHLSFILHFIYQTIWALILEINWHFIHSENSYAIAIWFIVFEFLLRIHEFIFFVKSIVKKKSKDIIMLGILKTEWTFLYGSNIHYNGIFIRKERKKHSHMRLEDPQSSKSFDLYHSSTFRSNRIISFYIYK